MLFWKDLGPIESVPIFFFEGHKNFHFFEMEKFSKNVTGFYVFSQNFNITSSRFLSPLGFKRVPTSHSGSLLTQYTNISSQGHGGRGHTRAEKGNVSLYSVLHTKNERFLFISFFAFSKGKRGWEMKHRKSDSSNRVRFTNRGWSAVRR